MTNFLSIIGTTSTGKTQLALNLAHELLAQEKFNGVAILSADSRQVYSGLEILTGSDVPATFISQSDQNLTNSFFKSQNTEITIHGQSIILPSAQWSLTHFRSLFNELSLWCRSKSCFLIVVGGTGLYQQQLLKDDRQLDIPPNPHLRSKSEKMSVSELQTWLGNLSPSSLKQMNQSDIQNPRRLVRAIEKNSFIADQESQEKQKWSKESTLRQISVGLKRPIEELEQAIHTRIQQRLDNNVVQEVERCIHRFGLNCPASTALGFKEVARLIQESINLDECKASWARKELAYSKRQLTWFKKYQPQIWFDSQSLNINQELIDLIEQMD